MKSHFDLLLIAMTGLVAGALVPFMFGGGAEEPEPVDDPARVELQAGPEGDEPSVAAEQLAAEPNREPEPRQREPKPLPPIPIFADPDAPTVDEMQALSGYVRIALNDHPEALDDFLENYRHLIRYLNTSLKSSLFMRFLRSDVDEAVAFLFDDETYVDHQEVVSKVVGWMKEDDYDLVMRLDEKMRAMGQGEILEPGVTKYLLRAIGPVEALAYFSGGTVGQNMMGRTDMELNGDRDFSRKYRSLIGGVMGDVDMPEEHEGVLRVLEAGRGGRNYYLLRQYIEGSRGLSAESVFQLLPESEQLERTRLMQSIAGRVPHQTAEYIRSNPEEVTYMEPEYRKQMVSFSVSRRQRDLLRSFAENGLLKDLPEHYLDSPWDRWARFDLESAAEAYLEFRDKINQPDSVRNVLRGWAEKYEDDKLLEDLQR